MLPPLFSLRGCVFVRNICYALCASPCSARPDGRAFCSAPNQAAFISELNLPFSSLSDAALRILSTGCLHLRELSLSDCPSVTDFGLYELAKLGPSLRYVSVAKCDQISDSGIMQLAKHCYKLRYLNVRGCEAVSDEAVAMLAKMCEAT